MKVKLFKLIFHRRAKKSNSNRYYMIVLVAITPRQINIHMQIYSSVFISFIMQILYSFFSFRFCVELMKRLKDH